MFRVSIPQIVSLALRLFSSFSVRLLLPITLVALFIMPFACKDRTNPLHSRYSLFHLPIVVRKLPIQVKTFKCFRARTNQDDIS